MHRPRRNLRTRWEALAHEDGEKLSEAPVADCFPREGRPQTLKPCLHYVLTWDGDAPFVPGRHGQCSGGTTFSRKRTRNGWVSYFRALWMGPSIDHLLETAFVSPLS